jgi:hypothetical protein
MVEGLPFLGGFWTTTSVPRTFHVTVKWNNHSDKRKKEKKRKKERKKERQKYLVNQDMYLGSAEVPGLADVEAVEAPGAGLEGDTAAPERIEGTMKENIWFVACLLACLLP